MNLNQTLSALEAQHNHAVRVAVLDHIRDVLLNETSTSLTTPLPPLAKTIAPSGSLKRKAKGGKRDPEVLAALTTSLASYISRNPGQRIEQIAKAMDATTKDLVLPAKKLIASGAVKTRGQKRATVYVPTAKAAR
jgi:hypothetical protein